MVCNNGLTAPANSCLPIKGVYLVFKANLTLAIWQDYQQNFNVAMIPDWCQMGSGCDFPFNIFLHHSPIFLLKLRARPYGHDWARLREAQKPNFELANTSHGGYSSIAGEWNDISSHQ